jgi:hypothetical protein
VIELPPEEDSSLQSLYADDVAVVINGTALLTKPKSNTKKQSTAGIRTNEVVHVDVEQWTG